MKRKTTYYAIERWYNDGWVFYAVALNKKHAMSERKWGAGYYDNMYSTSVIKVKYRTPISYAQHSDNVMAFCRVGKILRRDPL